MKRYDLTQTNVAYTTDHEMELSDDGEWVRYEDVEAIMAGHRQRLALIRWWSEQEGVAFDVKQIAKDIDFAIDVTEPRDVLLARFEDILRKAFTV